MRMPSFAKWRIALLSLVALTLIQVALQGQTPKPRRIAVFGSSVAFGTGDEFNKEGYTGMLREMLKPQGWEVLNQSRPGDSTITMAPRFTPEGAPVANTRYLTTVNPSYVVIALSFGNEGLYEAKDKEGKDAVFKQYADGIKGFIDKSRKNNITPVVTLVYPRSVYTPTDYEYARKMNLLQNTWEVPTVNFLGALDDGNGRWASGFEFNDKHPNAMGHRELATTFVPTLFEALEKGKPTPTRPADTNGFARTSGGTEALTFAPTETMHPFAMSVLVRAQGGTIAMVSGSTLAIAKDEMKGTGNAQFREITMNPTQPFNTSIGVQNGKWAYKSSTGTNVESMVNADNQWHHIVLSHYTARGETLFFVDGKLSGKVSERLEPKSFTLGGTMQADYKDLFIFRSALNADEVAALHEGKLLQASLEIYSPLNDMKFPNGSTAENRAQSLTALKIGTSRITHMTEAAKN